MKIQKINDLRGMTGTQFISSVFVVHGRNEAIRESVARFLEKIGLNVIILHEQPNNGGAVIDKFEHHARDVGFAVVLLTGDDVGGLAFAGKEDLKPRARQNVIFELGFFIAKLGRDKVCVLYEDGVEMPSDYNGIMYINLDKHEKWKFDLAREIKNAGYSIDMNKLI